MNKDVNSKGAYVDTSFPRIFIELPKDNQESYAKELTWRQQYGCISCCQAEFSGVNVYVLDNLTEPEKRIFDCPSLPDKYYRKQIKAIVEKYTPIVDVSIIVFSEALVSFTGKLYGNHLHFLLTYENCD